MSENDSIYIQEKINLLANHIKKDYLKYVEKYNIRKYISLNTFCILFFSLLEGFFGFFLLTLIYLHNYYEGYLIEKDSLYSGIIYKRGIFERFNEYYGYLVFKYYPLEVTLDKYPYFCLSKIGPLSNTQEKAFEILSKYNDTLHYKLKMLHTDSLYGMSYECNIAEKFIFKNFFDEYYYYILVASLLLFVPSFILFSIRIYDSYGNISIRDYIKIWDTKKVLNTETTNSIIKKIEDEIDFF